jgi:hypothetical protein
VAGLGQGKLETLMLSKPPFKRICVECNRNFSTDRPDARYCSSDCRRAHFESRRARADARQPASTPRTSRSRFS